MVVEQQMQEDRRRETGETDARVEDLRHPDIPKGSNLGFYFDAYVVQPMRRYVGERLAGAVQGFVKMRATQVTANTTLTGNMQVEIAGASVTIAPSTDSKRILLTAHMGYVYSKGGSAYQLYVRHSDGTLVGSAVYKSNNTEIDQSSVFVTGIHAPASTTAQTYKVYARTQNTSNASHTISGNFPLVVTAVEID